VTGDLLALLREYDLPPRWDGRAVWWDGWRLPLDGAQVFICGPGARHLRTRACEACGSQAAPSTSRGHVARIGATTVERWRERCEAWARLPAGERHRLGKYPSGVIELHAFRCPDCRTDLVWDQLADEWWTLDHTDYGPEGSVAL
jgi:hypothetical protein